MRHSLVIFALALFAFGTTVPSQAVAQGTVLAQAKTKKKSKKAAEAEATKESEEASKAASDATDQASEAAEEAAKAPADEKVEEAVDEVVEAATEGDADASERVPLTANFSKAELITTGSVFVVGTGLLLFGPDLLGAPDPSIGTPKVGSFDYDLSARFHGDLVEPGKFLFGVPDYTGLIGFPVGGSLFYLGSAAYYWGTGDTLFGQSVNIDHSAMGFIEALGWTALATGVTKQLVGRERPFKQLNRPEFGDIESNDSNVSFFSGHTSMSFAAASFMALDLSDHLRKGGSSWVTGTLIPYLSLYGLATLVGISRIYDQKHYASDVIMGALVGGLIGNLTYIAHFDDDGNPRIHHPEALQDVEVSVGPITTPSGAQGVGLLGRW